MYAPKLIKPLVATALAVVAFGATASVASAADFPPGPYAADYPPGPYAADYPPGPYAADLPPEPTADIIAI